MLHPWDDPVPRGRGRQNDPITDTNLTNAQIGLETENVRGIVTVIDGCTAWIDKGRTPVSAAIDLGGDMLIRGVRWGRAGLPDDLDAEHRRQMPGDLHPALALVATGEDRP